MHIEVGHSCPYQQGDECVGGSPGELFQVEGDGLRPTFYPLKCHCLRRCRVEQFIQLPFSRIDSQVVESSAIDDHGGGEIFPPTVCCERILQVFGDVEVLGSGDEEGGLEGDRLVRWSGVFLRFSCFPGVTTRSVISPVLCEPPSLDEG